MLVSVASAETLTRFDALGRVTRTINHNLGAVSHGISPLAATVEKEIEDRKLELVRFSFPDQHGVLRGKTLVAEEAAKLIRNARYRPARTEGRAVPSRTHVDIAFETSGIFSVAQRKTCLPFIAGKCLPSSIISFVRRGS